LCLFQSCNKQQFGKPAVLSRHFIHGVAATAGTWGAEQTIGDNGYSGTIAIDNVGI
jgi:hypothetical protein